MNRYDSGYYVSDYAFYPPTPYKGKAFQITFEDMPKDSPVSGGSHINNKYYDNKIVIIYAQTLDRAQYVNDLIHASKCALDGGLLPFGSRREAAISDGEEDPDNNQNNGSSIRSYAMSSGLPLACLLAAKASYRRANQHALFKLLLSFELFNTHIMDLDPSHWWPSKFVFASAEHHVHCAYSIIASYSVLEELDLEIRASVKTPSTIGGKWNPKVKDELETRLKKAGIDITDTFLWTMRDTPTKIEKARFPDIETKANWAYLKIRDSEIQLIDAIAYASWLRSKISAHKLNELTGSLNYYDVANVQHLARRLLLEKWGFLGDRYRAWPDDSPN